MASIVVKKFGGTSVGTPKNMRSVLSIVRADKRAKKIVVLSALSGTTNQLSTINTIIETETPKIGLILIDQLELSYKEFVTVLYNDESVSSSVFQYLKTHFFDRLRNIVTSQEVDKKAIVLAMGEQMSTYIFGQLLTMEGIAYLPLDALSFMKKDAHNQPDFTYIAEHLNKLLKQQSDKSIIVTQGFICCDSKNNISNLLRGGSDYTASIIAHSVDATVCEIWTDIDGMHNNDPRVVKKTYRIDKLSFEEASELAYFGAKILHPTCIAPAQKKSIPVKILNTLEPKASGTVIDNTTDIKDGWKAIAAKDDITAIRIKSTKMLMAYGFLTKIFAVFEKYKTPIDMITTSEVAVSVTIDQVAHLQAIQQELATMGEIVIEHDHTIVSIVGRNVNASSTILHKIFTALDNINIRMISYGGSKNNISLLVHKSQKENVLSKLNLALFDIE